MQKLSLPFEMKNLQIGSNNHQRNESLVIQILQIFQF